MKFLVVLLIVVAVSVNICQAQLDSNQLNSGSNGANHGEIQEVQQPSQVLLPPPCCKTVPEYIQRDPTKVDNQLSSSVARFGK